MKKIIAVTNQKGGVGKTTTALSLIGALHEKKYRVLGVDLDPQGSLGFSAGVNIEGLEDRMTVYGVLKGMEDIRNVIVHAEEGDILPANISLSTAELELGQQNRMALLRNELRKVEDEYDFIVIDTPPALNILTMNAYVAAQGLIIPMVPEYLSLLAIRQIKETITNVRRDYNPDLVVLGILLNRYNMRLRLTREVDREARRWARRLHTKVFDAKIHTSVSVAEAPLEGESIIVFDPRSKPARDYRSLMKEVVREMEAEA